MTPFEKACRALCKLDGNPQNTMFEGKPMWASYAPQVETVLRALLDPSLEMEMAGSNQIVSVHLEDGQIGRGKVTIERDILRERGAASIWRAMLRAVEK